MLGLISTALAANVDTSDVAKISDFEVVFENIVSAALGLAGIVLFIMLVVGGFRYITAGGDPKSIEQAKKTLTYAIGGIVLIAAAFLILVLIQTITGANVTEFRVFQGNP